MKVHEAALRHGIFAEDAVQVAEWPLVIHAMPARKKYLDLLP